MTRNIVDKAFRIGLLVATTCVASCTSSLRPCFANCNWPLPAKFQPDADTPPAVIELAPTVAWMDTGIAVHKGDRFLFTATGEVFWQARNQTTGPDGEGGLPGWPVGRGGLRGRVGPEGKPFDLGARTGLFPDKYARRPHHPYPPPPITMPRDGTLYFGFKNFTSGANTGTFEVTIRPAVPIR